MQLFKVVEAGDKAKTGIIIFYQRQQKETYRDVKMSEEFTEPQQKEEKELLEAF